MGLFDSILPSLFSAGNQVKKNVRGLLADPVGQSNNLARSVSDNLQGLLGPLAGIQAETARGQGVLGSDPALQQAARDRQVAAVSNFLAPMATVWHGSPHKFDAFDSSKIGTGEGAQAYGHGLYLAEAPEVARTYSADRAYVGAAMQGKPQSINYDDPTWIAQKTIDELGDPAKAKAHLEMVARTAAKHMTPESAAGVRGAIDLVSSGAVGPKGNLYKVDLPDSAIAKMLDWDKPLSQQAPEAQQFITQKLQSTKPEMFAKWSENGALQHAPLGSWFAELAPNTQGGGNARAALSTEMQKLGIPGLRYLDGGSRGAGTGTRNYVVFPGNEGLLTILERNGKPLLGD
jgi:hypothetical protein